MADSFQPEIKTIPIKTKMPDLIDTIINKLSLSSLKMLDEIDLNDGASRYYSEEIKKCLNSMEEMYLNRCSRQLNTKTELLRSRTRKYQSMYDKYNAQFDKFKISDLSNDSSKKIITYSQEIEKLTRELYKITKESGEIEPDAVFNQILEMHTKIEELDAKCKELRSDVACYENFPANMVEAQYCLSDLREMIKKKEALLEKYLYGNNH